MLKIEKIYGDEILDSRGNPTVAVTVQLNSGYSGTGISPGGASTGKYEAVEKRDESSPRFGGKGVLESIKVIEKEIEPRFKKLANINLNYCDKLLNEIDGTDNKSNLGGNITLAVSMAIAKALAAHYKLPLFKYLGGASALKLPVPMMNILNGGAHASNNMDIQEFMIMPLGVKGESEKDNIREQIRAGVEIYHSLKSILSLKGHSTAVGDEGGFAPNLRSNEEAIETILEAIRKAGYSENEVKLCLDAAAGEWKKGEGENYILPKSGKTYTPEELISYWQELTNKYPIVSIEDPLGEDDFESFKKITARIGNKVQIVGDDLFVTNKKRLSMGIKNNAANAILVKPNQIGTLSETFETVILAKQNGIRPIISHRSGETEDTFIADLAVALNAPMIKTGAPARSERTAKYNRLMKIAKMI